LSKLFNLKGILTTCGAPRKFGCKTTKEFLDERNKSAEPTKTTDSIITFTTNPTQTTKTTQTTKPNQTTQTTKVTTTSKTTIQSTGRYCYDCSSYVFKLKFIFI
jgi:hypothetical protein